MVTLYSTGDLAEARRIVDAAVRDAQHGPGQPHQAAAAGRVGSAEHPSPGTITVRACWVGMAPNPSTRPRRATPARRSCTAVESAHTANPERRNARSVRGEASQRDGAKVSVRNPSRSSSLSPTSSRNPASWAGSAANLARRPMRVTVCRPQAPIGSPQGPTEVTAP